MNKIIRMEEAPNSYDLAGQIIGFAMKIHSTLGPGFLEAVYGNALAWELRRAGMKVERERSIRVYYEDELIGAFLADILVNGTVIVELKTIQALAKVHEVQLVNYLVATRIDEGLLLNFGAARLEFKKKFRLSKAEPVRL